ncbi:pentatricopeptide repeat-containing protein At1g03540 [Nymphaea colorata]|uniref:pentatricopeptide repeat-containing protein At1g03540 n=1 Tax=Nymphaea colorata TaxID=210225 RepID=UPI00129DD333|nr:pentatricopeptide repeat-containing protein At1g03540 [Nymphaea colorata]XP_031473489.1 pentatricopeptide repeat-containing protein At1g03540 [Nymphaea colorata]XP_031473490.1 pentatricopeptide repeat-containing protein At1g03540 [Nymphaea colorata]XP_031473491.1 pentatricopeptide repeat-containing protein At1g03540 [Nymphaea colorata]
MKVALAVRRFIATSVSQAKAIGRPSQSPLASHVLRLCKDGRIPEAIEALNAVVDHRRLGVRPVVYASLLQACARTNFPRTAASVHSLCVKSGLDSDRFVGNSLLSLYFKSGDVAEAQCVFDHLRIKDVVSWTSMISSYSKMSRHRDALTLFDSMRQSCIVPNEFTLSIMIKVCAEMNDVRLGRFFHRFVIDRGFDDNCIISSALIDMYGKCGCLDDAQKVFGEMPHRDAVSWTTMIAAFVQKERYKQALEWFLLMQQKDGGDSMCDGFAFGTALSACGNLGLVGPGRQLHSRLVVDGIEVNAVIGSALVDMYGKCGDILIAREVFNRMPQKNMVTWCCMLCAYCENDEGESVLELFREMQRVGMGNDHYSYGTILRACATLQALKQGKEIHGRFLRTGGERGNVVVESALIDMYSECGSVQDARCVFQRCPVRNMIVWNTMIRGLAQNGRGVDALEIYDQMVEEGMLPDYITFVGVLFACSHSGLIEQGRKHFKSMVEIYGISPGIEHHACMVDLLGRAGVLEEAEHLIKNSKFVHDFSLWAALLGSCAAHSNLSLAERVASRMIKLKPANHLSYILLANLYSAVGQWHDAERMRSLMKDRGIRKTPGKSWIEVKKSLTSCPTCDTSSERTIDLEAEAVLKNAAVN